MVKRGIANSTHQLRSRCSTFLIGSLMTCMVCLLPLLFAKLLMLVFFLRHSILTVLHVRTSLNLTYNRDQVIILVLLTLGSMATQISVIIETRFKIFKTK